MRQITKYAYANAKIRAMLSQLLDGPRLEALLQAKDLYEALDLLKKTQYAEAVGRMERENPDLQQLERELAVHDEAVFRKVGSVLGAPEKELVFLLLEKYEIESLKVVLRLWYRHPQVNPADFLPASQIIHPIDYKKILNAESIEEVIVLLDKTPYRQPLVRAREIFKQKESLYYLEAALDVDYYERVLKSVERFSVSDRKVALKIIGIEIDIENINWLIRLRKYYNIALEDMLEWIIPGGERINKDTVRRYYTTDGLGKIVESVALGPYVKIKEMTEQNIYLIEGFLYEFLYREVKRALAGFPFSIGTVLGYLILKRRETRNLISILNAKRYGWKKDELLALLAI